MSGVQRCRRASGGLIDRTRLLYFTCNGQRLEGYAGDTLASALLANGVRVVGRSFKYHRPRGVLSAGIEETNALFRVEHGVSVQPLVRATLQPLVEGLVASTENAWPSVDFDAGRVLDFTHGLWPAGFYNKTFKWPSWHWYEGLIRRSAGSGRLPEGRDAVEYHQHHLHCDLLVVGGGPAGIAEALAAARSGERVVIAELEPRLGGGVHYDSSEIDGRSASEWLAEAEAELAQLSRVRVLTSTLVAGYYDHDLLTAVDRSHADDPVRPIERLWKIRAQRVVLATGAIEQPLVFAHNDRPGIMLAGALRRYLAQYAVVVGRSVVVATNNDHAYRTAFALHDAGLAVPAIVDARPAASPAVAAEATRRGLEVIGSAVIVDTSGTRGVREVEVSGVSDDGRRLDGRTRTLGCDALAMSGGFSPTVHLFSQAGGRLRYDERLACFVPDRGPATLRVVGAAAGDFGGDLAIRPLRRSPSGPSARQWIDFRHDVTAADIELAVRENYTSVEHLKRYTTTGMSVDQGKTSNLNALSLLAELTDRPIAQVGTTTFRPVFAPVSTGVLAAGVHGELYSPLRRLPAHDWHAAHGADFDDYGGWQRPACYRKAGEDRDAAIAREARAVRNAVGLFDGSPLGKIEVKGPDAAEFLNRIYVNNALTLKPGKVRYGLMLNENGIVIDDGVFVCMAPEHYLVCTTSGGAERIAAWLEEWHQCEWPELRLVIVPVTTQWAVLTLAGPRARELLRRVEIGCGPVGRGAAAPRLRARHAGGTPGAGAAREFHGRNELRGERAGAACPGAVGGALHGRGRPGPRADRHRDPSRAAHREGLPARRQRHGRHDQSAGPGVRRHHREEAGRLRGASLADASPRPAAGPPAIRRARARQCRGSPRGGCAPGRQCQRPAPQRGIRDFRLPEPDARQVHRAGSAGAGLLAQGRGRHGVQRRQDLRGARGRPSLLRPERGADEWLT